MMSDSSTDCNEQDDRKLTCRRIYPEPYPVFAFKTSPKLPAPVSALEASTGGFLCPQEAQLPAPSL